MQQFNEVVIIMRVIIKDNKLAIITEPKTICFRLPKDIDNSLKHETDVFIKHNAFLAKNTIRNKVGQLLSKYMDENDIHKHRKQKSKLTIHICF